MQAEIKGTTMPVLEVTLEPGEQVISTHGELSWMTPNIQLSQHMGGARGALRGPAAAGSCRASSGSWAAAGCSSPTTRRSAAAAW